MVHFFFYKSILVSGKEHYYLILRTFIAKRPFHFVWDCMPQLIIILIQICGNIFTDQELVVGIFYMRDSGSLVMRSAGHNLAVNILSELPEKKKLTGIDPIIS